MFKQISVAGLLLSALAFSSQQQSQAPDTVGRAPMPVLPASIPHPDYGDRYQWLAAKELVGPSGFLDEERMNSVALALPDWEPLHVEALAAFNAGSEPPGCKAQTRSQGAKPADYPAPLSSFDTLARRARNVYSGTIVATEPGFSFTTPGTMLEIRVDMWLGSTSGRVAAGAHVFYPAGDVPVGMATLCAATFQMPPAPAVGDRILVFPDAAFTPADAVFARFDAGPNGSAIFWSGTDGHMRASAQMLEYIPSLVRLTSFEQVLSRMQVSVGRSALR